MKKKRTSQTGKGLTWSGGRERAKEQGKHMGRKAGFSPKALQKAIEQYYNRVDNKMSVSDILKLNGIPKASFYLELKKQEIESE